MTETDAEKEVAREADRLTKPDWSAGVKMDSGPSMRQQIANAMVGLKKEFYGKGPTEAKTYINDHYVFCVMKGGSRATSKRSSTAARRNS